MRFGTWYDVATTMAVASKIRTLGWFLRRPRLMPQAVELVLRKLRPRRDLPQHRREATAWCEAVGLSTETLLDRLGCRPARAFDVALTEAQWAEARDAAARCPETMGGPGHLELLYSCAEAIGAERCIETGVAYGWSSLAILASVCARPTARLISTDMPYVQKSLDSWVGCVVPDAWRAQWTLVREADRSALPRVLDELRVLDLAHYDSDKSYYGRMWAYPKLWDALRSGGILISDDIQDNLGFKEFVEGLGPDVVWGVVEWEQKWVGAILKP